MRQRVVFVVCPQCIVGLGNQGRDYARTRHNAGWMYLDRWAAKHCRTESGTVTESSWTRQKGCHVAAFRLQLPPAMQPAPITSPSGVRPSGVPTTTSTETSKETPQTAAVLAKSKKKQKSKVRPVRPWVVPAPSLLDDASNSHADRPPVPLLLLVKPDTSMNISGPVVRKFLKHMQQHLHGTAVANLDQQHLLIVHDELEKTLGKLSLKATAGSANGHNGVQSILDSLPQKDFARLRIGIGRPPTTDPDIVAQYVLDQFPPQEEELLEEKAFPQADDLLWQWLLPRMPKDDSPATPQPLLAEHSPS